ncbi:hypothetical protein FQN55_007201 [Onygenales sp. PD_40]|nr:hypothetical protein FQN55_007201 [Onygenales sp. PD_40]KAK2783659.1 hypothetical protein FQN53_009111 [Emmonsiellopsis sp. PD_33]KAK2793520.1 hypothetical protein FQN52_001106 [Onygenales sp. PD_12]KAK2799449.1 hypothetical protein FQN51_006936 [Onygenales sp. PD_10]
MAVLDHFEVTVKVDRKTAQEYEADEDETQPNKAVKYIESKAGAKFAIRINIKKDYVFDCDFLGFKLHIDGQRATGGKVQKDRFLASHEYYSYEYYSLALGAERYYHAGKYYQKAFKFVDAVVSEDSKVVAPNLNIGTIQLTIWRKERTGQRKSRPTSSTSFTPLAVISEKSTKGQAISHAASFAPEEVIQPFNAIPCRDLDKGPIAAFTFKYRSKKALQDLSVIPRSPSPVPPENRPVDELTVEEMRVLIERQRRETSIKNEHAQAVKRERSDTASSVTHTPQHKKSRGASNLSTEEGDSDFEVTPAPNRGRRKIEVISLLDDD